MVAINYSFMKIMSTIGLAASSQQASRGLAARQSTSNSSTTDPLVSFPPQCQSQCPSLITFLNCGSNVTCACQPSLLTEIQSCTQCIATVDANSPSLVNDTVQVVQSINAACGSDLTLNSTTGGTNGTSSNSSSSGSSGSTVGSSGALSLKATSMGVFVVAAAIGAHLVF